MDTNNGTQSSARQWFEDNAAQFENAATIEQLFTELSPEEQQRLNRYKLWVLEQGKLISIVGKDVLEFGAGHGRLALELPSFASYTGVDFSRNLVRIGQDRLARARLADRARLIASDCLAYEGPKGGFDIVCSLGMFPYLDEPEQVLQKMVYHLKPGGSLFIDFHHSSPVYDPIRRLRWRLMPQQTGGVSELYSRDSIRRWFQQVGLVDIRIVMREYPLLGEWYARRGWDWALKLRNWLAAHSALDIFGTDCFAFGTKPR